MGESRSFGKEGGGGSEQLWMGGEIELVGTEKGIRASIVSYRQVFCSVLLNIKYFLNC